MAQPYKKLTHLTVDGEKCWCPVGNRGKVQSGASVLNLSKDPAAVDCDRCNHDLDLAMALAQGDEQQRRIAKAMFEQTRGSTGLGFETNLDGARQVVRVARASLVSAESRLATAERLAKSVGADIATKRVLS